MLVNSFRPYFEQIEYYSWLREPDFCGEYRARWERDKALSVNCEPQRFELASFWRLVRDGEYAKLLREVGVKSFSSHSSAERKRRIGTSAEKVRIRNC